MGHSVMSRRLHRWCCATSVFLPTSTRFVIQRRRRRSASLDPTRVALHRGGARCFDRWIGAFCESVTPSHTCTKRFLRSLKRSQSETKTQRHSESAAQPRLDPEAQLSMGAVEEGRPKPSVNSATQMTEVGRQDPPPRHPRLSALSALAADPRRHSRAILAELCPTQRR